jgi:hypothetical protein
VDCCHPALDLKLVSLGSARTYEQLLTQLLGFGIVKQDDEVAELVYLILDLAGDAIEEQ